MHRLAKQEKCVWRACQLRLKRAARLRVLVCGVSIVARLAGCAVCTSVDALADDQLHEAVQATALSVTGKAELVRCAPVTLSPCLSVIVTPVDAAGHAAPVALPPRERLLSSMQVVTDTGSASPFYVAAEQTGGAEQRRNIVLIEVDVSGSMNVQVRPGVSRFAAAQQAIASYLGSMQEGVDAIAIVPFESHHVVPTIAAAVFTSKRAEALAQLKALPQPGSRSNTALYQAVFSGVQALQSEMAGLVRQSSLASDFQPGLLVMTDGKNEVKRGDDDGLLDGAIGMQQAVEKVDTSGLDVVGIGFGNREEIDVAALTSLSKRIFMANDADELTQVLRATIPLRKHSLRVTFLPASSDRTSLASRDLTSSFALTLPNGQKLTSESVNYLTPALSTPLYQRQASAAEMTALIVAQAPAISGWTTVLRNVLIFLALGALLLVLWFWVPRLVWGSAHDVTPGALADRRRWSGERTAEHPSPALEGFPKAPDGFAGMPDVDRYVRSAAQTTQLLPRSVEQQTASLRKAQ